MAGIGEQKTEPKRAIQKIEDFMEYAYPALQQFPKSEKYAMAADIKLCMDVMLERCVEAEKAYYKKTTLRELDVAIAKCKTYIKMAHRLGFLPEKKHNIMQDFLYEIGRMVGGWIKKMEETEGKPAAGKNNYVRK